MLKPGAVSAPRILAFQHHELEHPGVYTETLRRAGAEVELVRSFAGDGYPRTLATYDGLIVMGGPMSVGDDARYPWLRDERALIAAAIATDTPTLGVCLGSQLIAAVAGAPVTPGPVPEIGWYRITPTADGAADPTVRRRTTVRRARMAPRRVPAAAGRRRPRLERPVPGAGLPSPPTRIRAALPPRGGRSDRGPMVRHFRGRRPPPRRRRRA